MQENCSPKDLEGFKAMLHWVSKSIGLLGGRSLLLLSIGLFVRRVVFEGKLSQNTGVLDDTSGRGCFFLEVENVTDCGGR